MRVTGIGHGRPRNEFRRGWNEGIRGVGNLMLEQLKRTGIVLLIGLAVVLLAAFASGGLTNG